MPKPGARATALLALLTLLSYPASAQLPDSISIDWTGSPLCQRSAGLEGDVARLLGPAATRSEPIRFAARVDELAERTVNYYRLTLRVSSASQTAERSVELPTCGDVQDAAVLLIATAIDPTASLRVPEKPPEAPPPPPEGPVADEEAEADTGTWFRGTWGDWSGRALVGVDAATLPHPTLLAGVGALLKHARARFWGEARYLFARAKKTEEVVTEIDLFAGALGAAWVWPFRAFVVGPAAEVELGLYRARTEARTDLVLEQTRTAFWTSALVGAVAAYGVDRRVGVELSLLAGVPFRRPEVRVDMDDAFHSTSPVTMRLALGLRVSLGSPRDLSKD